MERDTRLGTELGFTGTPAMLVNMVPVGGFVPAEQFEQRLEEILARSEATPTDTASTPTETASTPTDTASPAPTGAAGE